MIILNEPKIIFLKSRKVAGTSFEIALSKFASSDSVITPISANDELIRKDLGFCGPRNYLQSWNDVMRSGAQPFIKSILRGRRPNKFYNHISAEEVKKKVSQTVWSDYKKISIIRNPFDYAVSIYFHSVKSGNAATSDFEKFCLENSSLFGINNRLYKIDGKDIIDFYIRYESIQSDIKELERKEPTLVGLSDIFSSIKAKGSYRPDVATTQEMFKVAPKACELIKILCSDDIQKFGFEVPC